MGRKRRKTIKYHLSKEKLDEELAQADNGDLVRRLSFVKNLYLGDTIKEAADRVGRSESTGDRWAEAWNKGGLADLAPNYGGGRPPKLTDEEQERLIETLQNGQPWKSQEIQHLLKEEFGVEYHPNYLSDFLRSLGLSYSIPRPKRHSRPEDADEILGERVNEALDQTEDDEPHKKRHGDTEDGWTVDDDIRTDGGTVVGFFDVASPQPYDNDCRVWYVDDPHIERPLLEIDE